MVNSTMREIAEQLYRAETILLYPHVGIDGDAVGSCSALARVLRKMGKTVYALYSEEIPENLSFMLFDEEGRPYFTNDDRIIPDDELDISMCVDCGGYDRFKDFIEKFNKAKTTICIDHHGTSEGIAKYNFIDPDAAACGELIYDLLIELNNVKFASTADPLLPDKTIGEMLFAAITTDTGNFQYSNTRRRSHEIMAELYDWGVDVNRVSVEIYQNERPEKILIQNKAMANLKMTGDGKGAIAFVSYDDLTSIGVKSGETDPIVQELRSIKGVEYAAFLKEKEIGEVRVSFRSKTTGNVSAIAQKHNGGGHIKAAGCTLYTSLEEAVKIVEEDIIEAINNEQ